MSSHQIQFQYGMSIPEFLSHFGTEAQCAEALKRSRWPQGFRCPQCSSTQHYLVTQGARKLYQCGGCRLQTSLTAGTLMEHTKLPLTTWFLAIHLISQAKTGISALALKRDLGVSYPTAWLLHHKINGAMSRQEAARLLSGAVQLDDAYLGGERSGGKPGRGSENKVPFVAAVSMNDVGQPIRLKLDMVSGFTSDAIAKWAKASLLPKTIVTSDGLGCFAAVTEAGCIHMPRVVGALKPRDLPEFKWINTVLGNLKTMMSGAFKALKYRKYAQTYLGAFAYRFNHRFDLRDLIVRLIVDAARTKPVPKKVIRDRHAEARF
jgi:transposase-like protein